MPVICCASWSSRSCTDLNLRELVFKIMHWSEPDILELFRKCHPARQIGGYQFNSGDSGNSAQRRYLLLNERSTSRHTLPRLFMITSGGTLAITHEFSLSSRFS